MFSAMNEVKDRIEGFEQGVDDYITKPFNFAEVLARIRAVLRSRELSRQLTRREKRIAVVESLNSSLVFFTQHIRSPSRTSSRSRRRRTGADAGRAWRSSWRCIRKEGREILATLRGLEDEVAELQGQGREAEAGRPLRGGPGKEAAQAPAELEETPGEAGGADQGAMQRPRRGRDA